VIRIKHYKYKRSDEFEVQILGPLHTNIHGAIDTGTLTKNVMFFTV